MNILKKVLIVEDDESIRESTKDLLELEGYTIECAKDGEEAMQILRCSKVLPDLILLDLMMPVKDGFQFRLEQQQEPKLAQIPVVIMTADGHAEEKKTKLNIKAHIKKPSDIETILEVVKQCCL